MAPVGTAPNTAQVLLQRHLAGEDVTGDLQTLVGDDPALAPVLQLLAHRADPAPDPIDPTDPIDAADAARDVELGRQREVLDLVRHERACLTDDVAGLRGTLEDLASALGACPVCVGARGDCVLCHGRGGPGWIPPDPAAFRQLVLPALRAHQYARRLPGRRDGPEPAAAPAGAPSRPSDRPRPTDHVRPTTPERNPNHEQ